MSRNGGGGWSEGDFLFAVILGWAALYIFFLGMICRVVKKI
jgi:hypothetical protein